MSRIFAVAATAVMTLVLGATSAAGVETRCVGVFSGVADTLIVPRGAECTLEGAQVRGNALAEPESMLFINGSTVGGNVEVNELAHTGAFQSQIGGNYKCDNCFFEDVVETSVGGSVQIVGADDGDFIIASEITGNLEIVESLAGNFAFVLDGNTVGGNVKLEKNQGPTVIVNNVITGRLEIVENNVAGAFCPPDAPPELCENGHFNDNRVGGNMQVFRNTGPTEVMRNVIVGNLQCFDNTPAPVSASNTAARKQGQCPA